MPRISVVMPVYDGENYLRTSIDSVLRQSFKDYFG
jgi:glycosyltransferase involved in cell wall biosynthesis